MEHTLAPSLPPGGANGPERRQWLLATAGAGGVAVVATAVTRSAKPEVFLAVGICTHLGCSPTAVRQGSANPSVGDDWPGGHFCPCPCHGSTFDGAGRAYKNNPVPTNLEIPPHRYVSATRILIGDDAAA